ncbi:MAG: hypothetical protein IJ109_03145 [Firmicutes bacterium]|nr:hypothetical protein [Bacillota bacterium]
MTVRKKSISMLIALAMFLTGFAMIGASEKAYAEGVNDIEKSYQTFYYPKAKGWNTEWLADVSEVTIDMATVKSSKPSVAVLKKDTWTDDDGKVYGNYQIKSKKPGTTTLTFQAKDANAENYVTKTVKVKVVKFVNPAKTFKIGSKNYAKKYNGKPYYNIKKKVSGKVNVKAKKGWKVDSIYFYDESKGKSKKIKNGKKVTFDKFDGVQVCFKKKGKNLYEWIYIDRY